MKKWIEKNPKSAYAISIILSVLLLILPIGSGVWCVSNIYSYYNLRTEVSQSLDDGFGQKPSAEAKARLIEEASKPKQQVMYFSMGVTLVTAMLFVVTRIGLKRMLGAAIQANEYDEFGRSKKKSYENLTRKEREAMDLQKTADLERILSTSVIKKITKEGSKNPEKELNEMIGLVPVKTKLNELIKRMEFEQGENKKKAKKDRTNFMTGRHMAFLGRAGTGKTTVARVLVGALYQYGYIKENKLIEIDGNFLKAGEMSAVKTQYVTQLAYGGVLFIDEAYAMAEGQYAKEIIATLIKEIEDNRDRFICILAGYRNDMIYLIDQNEGFKSRIKEFIDFPDYTDAELKEIFVAMCNKKNFVPNADALHNFEVRIDKERRLKGFGNGRTVRNVFEEALDKHATTFTDETRYLITGEDVSTAVKTI